MSKLKLIYLYIFSTLGLVLIVIGGVQLTNLALKTYVFKKADQFRFVERPVKLDVSGEVIEEIDEEALKEAEKENRSAQRQRDASQALSLLAIGIPVYLYHWRIVKRQG